MVLSERPQSSASASFTATRKTLEHAYGFDDVAIVPGAVTTNPEMVSTDFQLGEHTFPVPILASSMDGVVDPKFAINFSKLGGLARAGEIGLPGLSEPQVIRHFVRLSQKNYAIDSGLYPLGSCTMKHNPRLNEKTARLPGFGDIHPRITVTNIEVAVTVGDCNGEWFRSRRVRGIAGSTFISALTNRLEVLTHEENSSGSSKRGNSESPLVNTLPAGSRPHWPQS